MLKKIWLVVRLIFSPGFIDLLTLWNRGLRQLGWPESARLKTPKDHDGPLPWLTYAAIDYLDQVVPTTARILEIGGGNSTKWWSRRGNSVTTIESDEGWLETIVGYTSEHHFCRSSQEVLNLLNTKLSSGELFDVVVVDGVEPRSDYLVAASELLDEKGVLVVDNSERVAYSAELSKLSGLQRLDFFGIGPSNRYAWCTSVFFIRPPDVAGRSRLSSYVTTKHL